MCVCARVCACTCWVTFDGAGLGAMGMSMNDICVCDCDMVKEASDSALLSSLDILLTMFTWGSFGYGVASFDFRAGSSEISKLMLLFRSKANCGRCTVALSAKGMQRLAGTYVRTSARL